MQAGIGLLQPHSDSHSSTGHSPVATSGIGVSLFLSDIEAGTWSAEDMGRVAHGTGGPGARMVVTLGKQGAQEWDPTHGVRTTPIVPVPQVRLVKTAVREDWGSRGGWLHTLWQVLCGTVLRNRYAAYAVLQYAPR